MRREREKPEEGRREWRGREGTPLARRKLFPSREREKREKRNFPLTCARTREGEKERRGREIFSPSRLSSRREILSRERERERMGREGERFSLPLASPRDGKFCRERERETREKREEKKEREEREREREIVYSLFIYF